MFQPQNAPKTVTTSSLSLDDTHNINGNTVTFNVQGRVFRVRRSLLDSYPNTKLAQSASGICIQGKQDTTTATSKSNENLILIDRDSTRFAFVLDYMRDGCCIDLPAAISRESFLHELQYFGFDVTNIDNDCLTHNVPSFDAVAHVDKLHKGFNSKTAIELQQIKDFTLLAYICFCEVANNASYHCSIGYTSTSVYCRSSRKHQNGITIPQSAQGRIQLGSMISEISLVETLCSLENLFKHYKIVHGEGNTSPKYNSNNDNNTTGNTATVTTSVLPVESAMRTIIAFNKHLAVYGLECISISTGPTGVFDLHLKQTY
jgi:BTB/POZ domain